MLTTSEATEAIHTAVPNFGTEHVDIQYASGRTLRQSVRAERDQPPFDRVTMDGIALQHSAVTSGAQRFKIQGRQHAGEAPQTLQASDACIEIMTGAVLPANTDCIVPIERVSVAQGVATIVAEYTPEPRHFIHAQGSDHPLGHEILSSGHLLRSVDVAVLASCGLTTVEVNQQPSVQVISTGDELVAAGKDIASYQIRLSNSPSMIAMLAAHGFDGAKHEHILDDRALLHERLKRHLEKTSVLILSGGVSMGKADYVPAILAKLGVQKVFHRISQRPGKPMWFGIGPEGQAVFALPGNPVSALVCCRQYVIPALAHASGLLAAREEWAILTEDYAFKPALTCFLPVSIRSNAQGQLCATPVTTNTSGDFAALSRTDGYLELPQELNNFPAATVWSLQRWS